MASDKLDPIGDTWRASGTVAAEIRTGFSCLFAALAGDSGQMHAWRAEDFVPGGEDELRSRRRPPPAEEDDTGDEDDDEDERPEYTPDGRRILQGREIEAALRARFGV